MTECGDNQQARIDALAAGELRGPQRWLAARHAGRCAACRARLRTASALMGGLREMAEEKGGTALRERVFTALEALPEGALTEGALTPGPSPIRMGEGSPAPPRPERERGLGGEGAVRRRPRKRLRLALQLAGAGITCAIIAAILLPVFSQARFKARMSGPIGMGKITQDYDEFAATRTAPQGSTTGQGAGLYIDGTLAAKRPLGMQVGQSPAQVFAYSGGPPPANQPQAPVVTTRGNIVDRNGQYQATQGVRSVGVGKASDQPSSSDGSTAKPVPTPANPFQQTATPDRFLIRNATLNIEVKDARAAYDRLAVSVKAQKGYLSNLQETVDNLGVRTITMEVRVPADRFDGSMSALAGLGKVMDKQVTAEDVTEDYVDTDSTLRNLKRTEERLLAHLSRTGKLSDTLLVERELTRVREEIEKDEGHLRFLAHRIQYSTLDVTLREAAKALPAVPPASYSTAKEATDASRSLFEFLRAVWSTVVWVGIWAVVWAPLGAIGFLGIRKVWRAWVDAGTGLNEVTPQAVRQAKREG